jgi:hypothetical protein
MRFLHADEDSRVYLAGRTSEDEDRRFPEVTGKVPCGLETPGGRWVGLRMLVIVAKSGLHTLPVELA